jgi:ComF family protein
VAISIPPLNRWLERARTATLDLLFPPRCAACDAELPHADAAPLICAGCLQSLRLIDWPVCPRCAAPVPETDGVTLACSYCRGLKLKFDRTFALGSYEGLFRDMVLRMKDDRQGIVGAALVELAWQRLEGALTGLQFDVITAVPMNRWRGLERGVNPPRTLAERLARRLGVPAGDLLWLPRNIARQMGLSQAGRFRNVAGEMRMRSGYQLTNAHVLVVDDILTTGATCSEAARVLKRAGAAEVTAFVLARTPAGG